MFQAGDIREWRAHDVVDPQGRRIGSLEAIYVDTATDEPCFATVLTGLPTRRRLTFVPLAGATVGPGYLRVAHEKDLVKRAPAIDTDGELPAKDEPEIFAHYDIAYSPGSDGERRLARR
ncbi:PRC-barrel domain containing protein [Streptomyces sp. NPDC090106]|uniref:PRC-barrel domain containing protein n=1 Tax=Streptomyces sp. NPDC090106 TaxID=3365946 RepID=UPI0038013731